MTLIRPELGNEVVKHKSILAEIYPLCLPYFQVTTVGMVREVNENPTRIDYKIDDMTGPPMDVRHFVDVSRTLAEEKESL